MTAALATLVYSSHRPVSCDESCWTCLTCGAHFQDAAEDVSPCTGRTDQVHGDTHENGHELECADAVDGQPCEHTDPACTCDFCL